MSQSRTRRAGSGAREASRLSGDSGANNPQQNPRTKSKNKIPKSVRYDLENALLGLCDVWFEEIKPHLIQNNIKLHVEGSADGVAADGDHRRADPACSHLDPGAAFDRRHRLAAGCAACCQTQQTALRVPCRRPPSLCPIPPLSLPPPTNSTQVNFGGRPRAPLLLPTGRSSVEATVKHVRINEPNANSTTQTQTKRRSRRKKAPPAPEDPWRVSRPCHIYAPKMELPRTRAASPPPPRLSVNKVSAEPRSLPRGSNVCFKETLNSWKMREHPKEDLDMSCSPAGTFSVKHEKKKKKDEEASLLFSPGLINIIGEKYDKRIRVLFKNPTTEESCASIINLVAPTETRRKRRTVAKKMPWR